MGDSFQGLSISAGQGMAEMIPEALNCYQISTGTKVKKAPKQQMECLDVGGTREDPTSCLSLSQDPFLGNAQVPLALTVLPTSSL